MPFSDQISISVLAASTEVISRNKGLHLQLFSSLQDPLPAPLIATEAFPTILIRTIPASTSTQFRSCCHTVRYLLMSQPTCLCITALHYYNKMLQPGEFILKKHKFIFHSSEAESKMRE